MVETMVASHGPSRMWLCHGLGVKQARNHEHLLCIYKRPGLASSASTGITQAPPSNISAALNATLQLDLNTAMMVFNLKKARCTIHVWWNQCLRVCLRVRACACARACVCVCVWCVCVCVGGRARVCAPMFEVTACVVWSCLHGAQALHEHAHLDK